MNNQLRVFASRSHNIGNLVQGGHPQNSGGIGHCSEQKTCNISETGRDMTNNKSHTRFRLLPKSTTLGDLEDHYALRFKTHASFEAHHEYLNEDTPILSATKMLRNDCSFWQYKVELV